MFSWYVVASIFIIEWINFVHWNAKYVALGQATAEVYNLIAYNDGLKTYDDYMRNALNNVDSFLSEPKLVETHETAKNESIAQVKSVIPFCSLVYWNSVFASLKLNDFLWIIRIYQFLMARKLGNDEMIEEFIQRIHNATEEKRKIFEEENIQKHNEFIVSKQKKKKFADIWNWKCIIASIQMILYDWFKEKSE